MCYALNETVEICKKAERFAGAYYRATVAAAIGYTRYLVRYETRYSLKTDTDTVYLMEAVDPDEMRPLPPQFSYENRKLNDRVDAFIDGAWRVGRVTRFVDPNFYVRLDHDARRVEHHCPFYKVRLHLEWRNEQWFYCHDDGPQVQNQNQNQNQNQDGNPDPPQADQSQNKNQGGNPEHEQIQDRTDEMFRSAVGLPDYMIGSLDELRDPSGSDGEEGKKQQPTD